jgi:hypothetical protein
MKIYKYELGDLEVLEVKAYPRVKMPLKAEVLSAGLQGDTMVVWAAVPEEGWQEPMTTRTFAVLWTGQPLAAGELKGFIATIQGRDGLVWHVFEEQ